MGIADRDYMRERYLERHGLPGAETRWNEQKARADLSDDYFTGSWRTRIRHHQARQKAMLHALLLAAGSAVIIAGVTHRADVMRGVETLWRHVGWSSFPATGTVSVSPGLRMDRVKSRLTLQGAADSAIVQLREPARRHIADRNAFSQKIVDFVAECRATGDILALIEVDDRSHDAARDARRDAMTGHAGYRTIRIPGSVAPNFTEVRACVATLLTPPGVLFAT